MPDVLKSKKKTNVGYLFIAWLHYLRITYYLKTRVKQNNMCNHDFYRSKWESK